MSDSLLDFLREQSKGGEVVIRAEDGNLHFNINGRCFGFAADYPAERLVDVAKSMAQNEPVLTPEVLPYKCVKLGDTGLSIDQWIGDGRFDGPHGARRLEHEGR